MVNAVEQIEHFDSDRGAFASWLFTIAARRVIDHRRAHRRLLRFLSRWSRRESVEASPAEHVIRQEEVRRVLAGLNRLRARDREIIALRCIAELSTRETAEVLGISEGAVRTRLHRALGALTSELGDDDVI
jgi:RNA polymerase sigma-70 factor, ECF subfamily